METKNMIGGIVSLAVVVICVAAIMMPVINDAEYDLSTTTYENEGTGSLTEVDLSSTVTLIPTTTGWTLNGEAVTYTETTQKYIFADTFRGNAYMTNAQVNVEMFVNELYKDYITQIVIEDGTATFTRTYNDTTTTYTSTCEWLIISDDEGDMTYCTDGAYTDGSFMAIYPQNIAYSSTTGFVVVVEDNVITSTNGATITNGVVADISESVTSSLTTTDNYSVVTVTYSDTDYTLGILAPKSISYTVPNAQSSLIAAIPIIVIASIVVASVGLVVTRRD